MATPTIREILHTATSGTPSTVVTGAGTQVDDVLVTFHGSDYYTAAAMGTPTGTSGTWTHQATGDMGTNNSHIKVWTRPVTVAGAQTVTTSPQDEECWNITYVIAGADTTDPSDDAQGGNGTASVNHAAPSVSPSTSDALLICAVLSELFRLGNYTGPSGMTKQTEDDNMSTLATATQDLTSSGATGAKTFTFDSAFGWCAVSIAIPAAAGATPSRPSGLLVAGQSIARAATW